MRIRMSNFSRAGANISALVFLAAVCFLVYTVQPLEATSSAVRSRQLQTVLAQKLAEHAQDRWYVQGDAAKD